MAPQSESHRFWHAFCIHPQTRFETQRDNETVILTLRAHPITLLPWIANTAFLLILYFVGLLFLPQFLTPHYVVYSMIAVPILIFTYAWSNFIHWFFNVGIVTNQRIIDVDFHNLLYKEIAEAKLEKIEEMTSKGGGYLSSLVNYGSVYVMTAGEEPNIEFIDIPDPAGAIEIINSLQPSHG